MGKVILSLDGGGIRGAATTQFLYHVNTGLQERHDKSLRDCVDFYAGTSTGAIIALALATTQLSVDDINQLYNAQNATQIFAENEGLFELDGINAPKYEASGKRRILQQKFGDASLAEAAARDRHVLAVTYNIEARKPCVIKTTDPQHLGLKSCDVADASSAAPTYFPTRGLAMGDEGFDNWLIDGGVTANNPTLCAMAEARRLWPQTSMDEMRILSVGTGYRTRKINGPASCNWGALGWMTQGNIIDILSDERVVAYQAITMATTGNYIRVNAEMRRQPGLASPPDDAMDDVSASNILRLKKMGDFWFEQYGSAVVDLLAGTYEGTSLDRIDPITGKPKPFG
ncbi:patatin-like phospholipase family protein [Alteromonas halophila]|uniref:Patatin n=1 Tax=Alteromonas halophila TaxID=516698 RepID=A0A918JQT5_9ALTE|nr:patatin-like phospholipase family protein [Alteromonas halophila]GGW93589.1 patatin [Alteromonas halophila]